MFSTTERTIPLARAVALLGATVSLAALLATAIDLGLLTLLLAAWTSLPYALVWKAQAHAETFGKQVAVLVVSLLLSLFAAAALASSLIFHISSTSALALLFIPYWQFAPALMLYLVLWGLRPTHPPLGQDGTAPSMKQ